MEVDIKKTTFKVVRIAAKMMERYNKKTVTENYIISALILHYLSESKLSSNQLNIKLKGLDKEVNIEPQLEELSRNNLVEKEGDFYKINIEELF